MSTDEINVEVSMPQASIGVYLPDQYSIQARTSSLVGAQSTIPLRRHTAAHHESGVLHRARDALRDLPKNKAKSIV